MFLFSLGDMISLARYYVIDIIRYSYHNSMFATNSNTSQLNEGPNYN